MGKLVAGSGGIFFENEEDPIINHVISLARARDSWVWFPTAGHDSHEDEDIVRDYVLRHGFKKFTALYLTDEGLTDGYIRDTILSADVVYARGGDLKFLMETWRRTKADVYLREAYGSGTVLAGQSSGAMCWFEHGYDNCGKDGRYMFIRGIGIQPFIFCPHFEDWQCFLGDVGMQELDAIGCDNDIAVSVVDGRYEIIDSHRNPVHSAWYMPASEDWKVHDIVKEKPEIPFV